MLSLFRKGNVQMVSKPARSAISMLLAVMLVFSLFAGIVPLAALAVDDTVTLSFDLTKEGSSRGTIYVNGVEIEYTGGASSGSRHWDVTIPQSFLNDGANIITFVPWLAGTGNFAPTAAPSARNYNDIAVQNISMRGALIGAPDKVIKHFPVDTATPLLNGETRTYEDYEAGASYAIGDGPGGANTDLTISAVIDFVFNASAPVVPSDTVTLYFGHTSNLQTAYNNALFINGSFYQYLINSGNSVTTVGTTPLQSSTVTIPKSLLHQGENKISFICGANETGTYYNINEPPNTRNHNDPPIHGIALSVDGAINIPTEIVKHFPTAANVPVATSERTENASYLHTASYTGNPTSTPVYGYTFGDGSGGANVNINIPYMIDFVFLYGLETNPDLEITGVTVSPSSASVNTGDRQRFSAIVSTSPAGENLAFGKAAAASSSLDDNTPVKAVDGLSNTWWKSGGTDNEWFEIELDEVTNVSQVAINWERAYAETYSILTSTNGSVYSTAAQISSVNGNDERLNPDASSLAPGGSAGLSTINFPPVYAKFIKIQLEKSHMDLGFSVLGFEVYGREQALVWSVSGNSSSATTISNGGLLTVAPYETAETLIVKAASVLDASQAGTATVAITKTPQILDSATLTFFHTSNLQTGYNNALFVNDKFYQYLVNGGGTSLNIEVPGYLLTSGENSISFICGSNETGTYYNVNEAPSSRNHNDPPINNLSVNAGGAVIIPTKTISRHPVDQMTPAAVESRLVEAPYSATATYTFGDGSPDSSQYPPYRQFVNLDVPYMIDFVFDFTDFTWNDVKPPKVIEIRNTSLQIGATPAQRNVVWYSSSDEEGVVQLALKSAMTGSEFPAVYEEFDATAKTTAVPTGFISYRTTLTGLASNTEYVYRVGNDECWSDTYSFKTTDFDGAFSCLIAADVQASTQAHENAWEDTVTKALTTVPSAPFMILLGDNVDSANSEPQYDILFSPENLKSVAIAPAHGNHDVAPVYSSHFYPPNVSSLGVTAASGSASGHYWYVYNNTLFMVLNNYNLGSADMKQFMQEAIALNPQAKWRVVANHYTYFSVGNDGYASTLATLREEMPPIFSDLGIDVVLSGHDHTYMRTHMMDGRTPILPAGGGVPSSVTDPNPRHVLYLNINSATGSIFIGGRDEPFVAVKNQENITNFSSMDITDTSLAITTYRTNNLTVVDTFTIYKDESFGLIANAGQEMASLLWSYLPDATALALEISADGGNTWTPLSAASTGIRLSAALTTASTKADVLGLTGGATYQFKLVVTGGVNAGEYFAEAAIPAPPLSARDMSSIGQQCFDIKRTSTPPVIDGTVNAAKYGEPLAVVNYGDPGTYFAPGGTIQHAGAGEVYTGSPEVFLPKDMTIYATYDDACLYVGVTLFDDNHHTPRSGPDVWIGDYLEVDIGARVGDSFDDMRDRSRFAIGMSNDGEVCMYSAMKPSYVTVPYTGGYYSGASYIFNDLGTVTRDENTNITTYEMKLPWAFLTSNGKPVSEAFFMVQAGIGHSDFIIDEPSYPQYLGVFRHAAEAPLELRAEVGGAVVYHIVNFEGVEPLIPVVHPVSSFGDSYYYFGRTNPNFFAESLDMSVTTGWTYAKTAIGFGAAGGREQDGTVWNGALATTIPAGSGPAERGAPLHTWMYTKKTFELPEGFDVNSIIDVSGIHRIDDALVILINGVQVYRYNTNNNSREVMSEAINWGVYTGRNTDVCNRPFTINSDYNSHDTGFRGTSSPNELYDAASLTNLKNALRLGTNIITCVVGQRDSASSDIWFDLQLSITTEGGSIPEPEPFAAEALTLQPGANATALNFNWYSDRDTANNTSVVKIAKASDPSDVITVTGTAGDASAGKSWHKAGVTGLARNTAYTYRVSNDGVTFSEANSFKTGAEGAFQFVAVGDPQLTTGNQDSDSVWPDPVTTTKAGWQDTLNKIADTAPNARFMAGTGDQVDTATDEVQYTNYFAPEQLRSLPVSPAVGNHEGTAPNFGWHFNVPNETDYAGKSDAFGNYWYTYNNALFVVLNTAPYPANAAAAAPYIEIMDATLKAATEANPDARWLFVQHHKTTASPASHQTDTDVLVWAPLFNALMDKYSVDFVLAGHDHVYSRSWVIKDNQKVDADYTGNAISDPQGTIYFTFTTASGLKYYDFLVSAPAAPAWVSDTVGMTTQRKQGPNAIGGKPWYTNVGIQIKAPQFTTVDVTDGSVTFKTYRTDTMAVIDEYTVTKTNTGQLSAGVTTAELSTVGELVEFVFSLRGLNHVNTIAFDFTLDGGILDYEELEGLNNFEALPIRWTELDGGQYKGNLTLVCLGDTITSADALDVVKLFFNATSLGDATITINSATLTMQHEAGGEITTAGAVIESGPATTSVVRVYSIYDITRDGTIGEVDLAIVALACGVRETDARWNQTVATAGGRAITFAMCDVNGDGKVDMQDLLDVFLNYAAAY